MGKKFNLLFLTAGLLTNLIYSCVREHNDFAIYENKLRELNRYTTETLNINLISNKSTILMVIKFSQCDCVEKAIDLAETATHYGVNVLLVGKYQKDFIAFNNYIKQFPKNQVHYDFNDELDSYNLNTLPSTFIIHVKNGKVIYGSQIDYSTKDEIVKHFNWK